MSSRGSDHTTNPSPLPTPDAGAASFGPQSSLSNATVGTVTVGATAEADTKPKVPDAWDDDWDPFEAIPPINWQSPFVIRTIIAFLASILIGASGGFVYLRFISPPSATLFVETFPTPYLGELWWKMSGTDRNGLRWTPGGYRFSPRPGQSAYITFDITDVVIPLPTWRTSLRNSIGSYPPPTADRLILDLRTERRGNYLTIFERPPLHVQATQYGLMITTPDPANPKEIRNTILPDPTRPEGSIWQLEYVDGVASLTIDGRPIWEGPVANLDKVVMIGETRNDPEHDGTMIVRSVKFGGSR